jgi:uncharacterized protein with FMN-binding domain
VKAKAIIIIVAVAILGFLGVTNSAKQKTSATPAAATGSNSNSNSATSPAQVGPAGAASYKDGDFTGSSQETPFGTVQVEAIINAGKITDVKFLQMPFDQGHSREVTAFSEPILKQVAIERQSAKIDFVSGATDTSIGFERSLQAALDQAATG